MILIDLLPEYYRNSRQVTQLQEAFGYWINRLLEDRDSLLLQLNVESATWGLDLWEAALGILPDSNKPYEQRRSLIMSRLRGQGTTTIAMIKNVALSFTNGTVDITETYEAYTLNVAFVDIKGIPPNMEDFKAAVEKIKPAHLAVTYTIRYTVWSEFKSSTWAELKTGTWGELMTRNTQ